MNKSNCNYLGTALSILILAIQPLTLMADDELLVSLEYKVANTNRAKFGYTTKPECAVCPSVPKYYKTLTKQGEGSLVIYSDCPGADRIDWAINYTEVWQYTSATTRSNVSATGSSSYEEDDGDAETQCYGYLTNSLDRVGDAYWVTWNGLTNYDKFAPGKPCYWWYFDDADCEEQCNSETEWTTTCTFDEGNCGKVGTRVDSGSLSSLYATEELLSTTGFDYPNAWSQGNETEKAVTEITSDNSYASIVRKMKYRFKVKAPLGIAFDIIYFTHYSYIAGEDEVLRVQTNRLHGVGTGQVDYYPPDGIEFPPPFEHDTNSQGCPFIVGASKWVSLGCSWLTRNGDDSDGDSNSGCGSFCMTSAGSYNSHLTDFGIQVSASLGSDTYGGGLGQLIIGESSPNAKNSSPSGIEYFGNLSDVQLIRPSGDLRQVKSAQVLADIVTLSPTSYQMSFYTNYGGISEGLYSVSGYSPISVGTVEEVGSSNYIRVRVDSGGVSVTNDYVWSAPDNGWSLTTGDGVRRESKFWDTNNLTRTTIIRDISDQVVYKKIEFYQSLTNGLMLKKKVVDPDGAALTAQRFYYDNDATDGANYGSVKTEIAPTGFWKHYEYDANNRLTKEISQFLNASTNDMQNENLCRVVEYDYNPVNEDSTCERRIEKLLGHEISRQYTLKYNSEDRLIQCQTAGADWDAADNLVNITRYYTSGDFVGEIKSVTNPDGTMQLYEYAANATQKTTTVYSGQADSTGTSIENGTETETVTALTGSTVSRQVTDIASEVLLVDELTLSLDGLGRPTQIDEFVSGASTYTSYACCGVDTTTDREGIVTQYHYDALKRQTGTTRNGVTTTNIFDAVGRVLGTFRIGSNGSVITNNVTRYDVAGRVARTTNALGGYTLYTNVFDGSGQAIKTNTYADGGTHIETYYQDGSLQKVFGTAVFPVRHEYGAENDGTGVTNAYTKEIKLNSNGSDTGEWTKTYTDMMGRTYKTVYADGANSQSFYNNKGQLWKQRDPDNVIALFAYNDKGEQEYTITALSSTATNLTDYANLNVTSLMSGVDRITEVTRAVVEGAPDVNRIDTYVWEDGSPDGKLISRLETAVDGLKSWSTTRNNNADVISSKVTRYIPALGLRIVTNTAPDTSYAVTTNLYGRVVSVTRYPPTGELLTQTTYDYDAHNRQYMLTDARNGTATNWFNNADQISGTATPDPGSGSQVTTNFFSNMGRVWKTTLPDGTSVTNEYFPTGLLKKTYGSRTYPVSYTYDYAGRMKTMTTWTNFPSGSSATTTWNYNTNRGWLDNKRYADYHGPDYTYTPAGRLQTRTWARGVTTTYGYNGAGELNSVDYSDSTPDVSYGYDRRRRQTAITSGIIITSRTYNDAGQWLTESYSFGPLNGLSVTNGYDSVLRRTAVGLASEASPLAQFGYDNASRLATVANGSSVAGYTYLANSPLVGQIGFTNSSVQRMVITKQYDTLNRLTSITNEPSGAGAIGYRYVYNDANQRTTVTNVDTSRWVYQYDALGQVISGKKYWSDGTPVAGQQFDYTFDTIGNRKTTTRDSRSATYLANNLNQYTSGAVPGYVNILGSATNTATVSVNEKPTTRHGDYFRAEVPVANSNGSVYLGVTNLAVLHDGSASHLVTNITGQLFVPKTPEVFTYDLDGNLTSDGRWTYDWDGENRLTNMTSLSSAPVASRLKIDFRYDWQGRRVEKIVSTNDGSAYYPQSTNKFVYDGWNLVAVLDSQSSILQSFMWGLDLSGSMQGAGGVGGLLMINSTANGAQFCAYDGNGNLAGLVNASDGMVTAQYEYGPFGELIRATGPMAKANPLRFSTKYQDDESDLLYYGYRSYNPTLGRWLSRDPILERGGQNMYAFVGNRPLNVVDVLGREIYPPGMPENPPLPRPPGKPPGETGGKVVCCKDECDKDGEIDHFETTAMMMPGSWDLNRREAIDTIKKAIKKACRGRARYAKDPVSVAVDLLDKFGQEHLEQTEGVRLFTILNYRMCLKGKCKKWFFGKPKCAPLLWSPSTTTEPRECHPLPGMGHPSDPNTFVDRDDAQANMARCAEEHAHEIWNFE